MMGQPLQVAKLTIQQLKNVIENHRKQSPTTAPTYLEDLRELDARAEDVEHPDEHLAQVNPALPSRPMLRGVNKGRANSHSASVT